MRLRVLWSLLSVIVMTASVQAAESENPLEHIVQHPLIERPASWGPLTPNGRVTVFSDLPSLRLFGWLSAFAMVAALIAEHPAVAAPLRPAAVAVHDDRDVPRTPLERDIQRSGLRGHLNDRECGEEKVGRERPRCDERHRDRRNARNDSN